MNPQDTSNPKEAGAEPETLGDWRNHWTAEFKAARDALSKWHEQGDKIDKVIRDERESIEADSSRWNLYTSNREVKLSLLYGQPPKVSVDRRFADQNDDIGRLAGEVMSRVLNTDIERKSDGTRSAYRYALMDRLDAGWGLVRARYVVEFSEEMTPAVPAKLDATGQELAPAVPAQQKKTFEDVETDYVHWKDQLWQPCRFFHEMGWWAHKSQMTRAALVRRFGQKVGQAVPLKGKNPASSDPEKKENQWDRADVWEIWDKDHEQVFWFVEDYGVLEMKPDPYGLDGFWPFAAPMVAGLTNSKFVPRPDYVIAQDLYAEINSVSTRIKRLIGFVKVRGAYDKAVEELGRLLDGSDGDLIPAANWAAFAQNGGINGSVQFFDVTPVVNAILELRDYRRELVDAVNQIEGTADIMRGEATQAGATAAEQKIKARFGSVRMQKMQDDFARMCSEHQDIRAKLMAKFFDKETIVARCNCEFSDDKELIPAALELIKSPKFSQYRIEVKPEAVSLTDFAALKAERMEILTGLGGFFSIASGVVQQMGPTSMPTMLKIGQWSIAGMRGASQLEGIFDKAVKEAEAAAEQAKQNPQQAPPDPKVQAQQLKMQGDQMKMQADLQKEQMKHQNKLVELQAETAAKDQEEQSQARWNTVEASQKAVIQHATRLANPPAPGPKPRGVP